MAAIQFTSSEIATYYRERVPQLKQQRARWWRGPCPIHHGTDNNFAVDSQSGVYRCHSGCGRGGDIFSLEAALTGADFPSCKAAVLELVGRNLDQPRNGTRKYENSAHPSKRICESDQGSLSFQQRIECTYDYTDACGNPLYQVVRLRSPKDFLQRYRDLSCPSGWCWKKHPNQVLYRLPEVLEASIVFVVEGEKDVETLRAWGFVATTNAGGAKAAWLPQFTEALRGRAVIVIPDNDDPGRNHAAAAATALLGVAASIRILELPDLPSKGDITDWRDAGGTLEQFNELVDAAPQIEMAGLHALLARWGLADHSQHPAARANAASRVTDSEAKLPGRPTLSEDALYGVTGQFIRLVMPHTESDPAALLVQFLVMAGIYFGRTGFYEVEGTRHHTNLFAVIVGMTSKGRKGTSWGQVLRLFRLVNADFTSHVTSGISTGEGIIHAVRDEIWEEQPIKEKNGRVTDYERVKIDCGVEDKRLLIQEPEFARVLKNTQRETNNPSAVIREAWDSGVLNVLTKTNRTRATGAHIGIVGHITAEELRRLLTATEMANGFANRFLWIYSERSKLLPHGGSLEDGDLTGIADHLRKLGTIAKSLGRATFDPEAKEKWEYVYGALSAGMPGMLGAVLARAEPQVIRLATLYALLDGVPVIRLEHVKAALAIWDYSAASATLIFGTAIGDETADTIHGFLKGAGGHGASRTDISWLFKNNKKAEEIEIALDTLRRAGYARCVRVRKEAGPPVERWFAGPETAKAGIGVKAC